MSHALIWTEIDPLNQETELVKELPFAGVGTVTSGAWNKKIYKLKWLNTSVDEAKVWLDNPYGDIYTNTEFPVFKSTDLAHLLTNLRFDIRIAALDTYNIFSLSSAKAATNLNISSSSLAGTSYLLAPSYIDGTKITETSNVLVKSQTNSYENGLYQVVARKTGIGYSNLGWFYGADLLTAAKVVSIGSSSWYSYLENYTPFQFASVGTTDVIWVDRTTTYRLNNVKVATTSNLQASGAGLSHDQIILDNYTLALNDRVLVKDQTDRTKNGIYSVSSLYLSNGNTIVNPYKSSDAKDSYWDTALNYLYADLPVSVQVLSGDTYGGKYFRLYKAQDSVVKAFTASPEDTSGTSGSATTSTNWSDATHYYNTYPIEWYYEISSGSSIGFSFDTTSNAGTFTSAPNYITNYLGNSTLTGTGQTVLVKHYNPAYSGVYYIQSVGSGNTSVWVRDPNFKTDTGITNTILKANSSRSGINSPFFYLSKTTSYDQNFIINQSSVSVSERFIDYYYEPVKNLITSEISNFNNVSETKFYNSGIAISQRVLVSGQATTASQNGIYTVSASSTATTIGLKFYTTYSVVNGSIANSAGTASTFFLFSSQDYVSAGSTSVQWVDITSASVQTADLVTVKDKFTSGYIYPDDFVGTISSSGTVLVNTSNKSKNGYYDVTLGTGQKASFNYASSLKLWAADIYRNVTSSTEGVYTVSPNFRNEIAGQYLSRVSGGFADSTYADRKYGNIYVPEINFPNTENPTAFFTDEYKGSAFLQEIDFDWHTQDHQNYVVKAVLNKATATSLPLSAGTAISRKISNNTLISNNDDVLIYIGTGSSTGSTYNGIYRAIVSSVGASVYFRAHEDFDVSTVYNSGTNVKAQSSPYERPTKVIVQNGYFVQGSSFGYTSVYMIGELGYQGNSSALGASSTTAYDENQYNIGQQTFIKGSEVKLSVDYNNLYKFAKQAPIQHFINGDLANLDQVDGDIIVLSRGYRLYSTVANSSIKYYYELGDRVIYQDSKEDLFKSTQTNAVNGIYVITNINTNTWTYYLRKVKQSASVGHVDYPRRLAIHPNFNITDGAFPIVKYGGSGSTYIWSENNYYKYDVFVVDSSGNKTSLENHIDYDIYPDTGFIASYTSFGQSTDSLYIYLLSDSSVPKISEYPKPLYNRYHYVEQVLQQKYQASSSTAKTSGSYIVDAEYFQICNAIGSATTLDHRNNSDRKLWYKAFSNSNNYFTTINNVVSVGNTVDYFYTKRISSDGYFYKAGTAQTALFYDYNIFEPGTGRSTGLFYGKVYVDQVSVSGSGFSIYNWFTSLSLSSGDNVLVLNNNTASIANTLQSTYYNDNNVLIKHTQTGKRDNKIFEFSELTYKSAALVENANFTNPISPLKVTDGTSTYFLHYDPNITSRSLTPKTWYNLGAVSIYDCAVSSNSNISDFDSFGGVINGKALTAGNLVLVKNQTDEKQNGIYIAKLNNNYRLDRAYDLDQTSEIRNLGRVQFMDRTYELRLPNGTYSIGDTSGNTSLSWRLVGFGYTIDAAVATTTNYSGTALTTAFPDSIDGYTLSADEKVLLYSQTDDTQKYVGRFTQNAAPIFSRVTTGTANTSQFAITNCYVYDENRGKNYELYFNPNNTTLGTDKISWFERNYISDYTNANLKSSSNITLTAIPSITNQYLGALVIVKDQSNKKENGLYYIDDNAYYFLSRHEDLDASTELTNNKKINVTSGIANSGYHSIWVNETGSPAIGNTNIYFVKVNEAYQLDNCDCATLSNLNLSSLPSSVDGFVLKLNSRILVKDQTTKSENGIYVVTDVKNKTWQRASDLSTDSQLLPQLTVKVTGGESNISTVWKIKLSSPRTITNSQSTNYILGTDNIEWESVSLTSVYSTDPTTWQKIPENVDNAFYLGMSKMNSNSVSYSNKFVVAVKAPTSASLAAIGITGNGKVRNIKLKVEYKTIED